MEKKKKNMGYNWALHFTFQEGDLDDLVRKSDNTVTSIAAVMMQWILGPVKTGSDACTYSVQLLLGSFRGYYILSRARNRDNFCIICSVLPHKVQYDFTVQSIYSTNNDVSLFIFRALSQFAMHQFL